MSNPQIEIFSTCPQSSAVPAESYVQNIAEVARWSEEFGCKGILIYTDNSIVDPWLTSTIVLQNTARLCPLVAVQPVYMHPYSVAKMVTSLAYIFGRRVYLNMVAGGFRNDLAALNDTTPHDKRYSRLVEYTGIISKLVTSAEPVAFKGKFYQVENLRLQPPVPPELAPQIFISGSSQAGLEAAEELNAVAIHYPEPPEECRLALKTGTRAGIRVGIIARESEQEAWQVANGRFPASRKGELTHELAMKTSDSVWHKQLCADKEVANQVHSPYWLRPFETYKSFCPYLVGSYSQVTDFVSAYISRGFHTFILDIPPAREELLHISIVFQNAVRRLDDETIAANLS